MPASHSPVLPTCAKPLSSPASPLTHLLEGQEGCSTHFLRDPCPIHLHPYTTHAVSFPPGVSATPLTPSLHHDPFPVPPPPYATTPLLPRYTFPSLCECHFLTLLSPCICLARSSMGCELHKSGWHKEGSNRWVQGRIAKGGGVIPARPRVLAPPIPIPPGPLLSLC